MLSLPERVAAGYRQSAMSSETGRSERHLGLLGATGIGLGATVGGGILALAGVAFEATGPSAVLVFALNGVVALITAFAFAELAGRFPRSGGTYAYARRVLTVEAAFAVGWVVWFASVVAAVLYAMGFAVFLQEVLAQAAVWISGEAPAWLGSRAALVTYALAALVFYAWSMTRSAMGGGQWATVGKVVVFVVLIGGGVFAFVADAPPPGALAERFRPFFAGGLGGFAQAMGYTFIALQGFDLIAAMGGEVRDPKRNVPKSMFLCLGVTLAIYLPLLLLITAVGTPGESVGQAAARNPEILVATAARVFMGSSGYWIVVLAGLLSMLSALQANVLAASRFASAMAADRTLPQRYAQLSPGSGAPSAAVALTAAVVALLLVVVPDVATAGAVASLIFLGSFSLTHLIGFLARRRTGRPTSFAAPWFPAVPIVGGAACVTIALYQAVAVPPAGVLAALWLGAGALLYALFLAPRARSVDAGSEGLDPQILRLRGRRPVVLVPIANPANAEMMVTMAKALAPPDVSRVQLLSVVDPGKAGAAASVDQGAVASVQAVLGRALGAALELDMKPEALITMSGDPWSEIARVADAVRCEKLVLGVGDLDDSLMTGPLARLVGAVDSDVVIMRTPQDWDPNRARRILVPSRGGRDHSPVRARLLGNLARAGARDVAFLGVVSPDVGPGARRRALRDLERLARDEAGDAAHAELRLSDDVVGEVARRAKDADLLVLGFHGRGRRRAVFSETMLDIARATKGPLVMIRHRTGASILPGASRFADGASVDRSRASAG